MAEVRPVSKVKLFCGIIAVSEDIIGDVIRELAGIAGDIDRQSDTLPFEYTDYYTAEMGGGLLRKFVAFSRLIDPDEIVDIKLKTNDLEEKFGIVRNGTLLRRVNLDPGYLNASRLVLATTKDFSHRIYLGKGIYAEITLNFDRSGSIAHPWTYPDFKSDEYQKFFLALRKDYLAMLKDSGLVY